jgi:LysM repeat protein
MPNTSPRPAIPSRICPSCGTRIADTASRCAVCGMVFETGSGRAAKIPSKMSGTSASLNLPVGVVIAGPILTLLIGALAVVFMVRSGIFPGSKSTPALPPSVTPTITLTSMPTNTEAPTSTPTPLPPIKVTVQAGVDTCYGLAGKFGLTDINLITTENGKPVDCNNLQPGQVLLIPQPTPTPPPASTATAGSFQQTVSACTFETYTVKDGDNLSAIAANYNVSIESIKKYNPQYSFANDVVFVGMVLKIPLCERLPTAGATPTPTTPPPYPAPNLLSPRDGTIFGGNDQEIALQWAAVATLRDNEEYQVTIENISSGTGDKILNYVKDTRFIVPVSLRPTDGSTRIYRWSVNVVRISGTTDAGNPIYLSAGLTSERRVFAWGGAAPAIPTPTP